MTKKELLKLIEHIPDEDEIYFLPDEDCFIDEGLTAFSKINKRKIYKNTFWLHDCTYEDFESMQEIHSELGEGKQFSDWLKNYDKITGWIVEIEPIEG